MIPNTSELSMSIEEENHPTLTFRAVVDENLAIGNIRFRNRINGLLDDLDAVEQSVYLILGTERYKFPIYSWDYGIELADLFGKPMPFVMAELPERIKEALTVDERISNVTDFEFTQNGKKLEVSFTVVTDAGNLETALELEV